MKRRLFIGAGLLILLLSIGALLSNCGNVESVTSPSSPNLYNPGSADTTPPTVISVTPLDGATSVGVGELISATFSEPISAASVTTFPYTASATFVVSSGGTPVPGMSTVIKGNTAYFIPLVLLSPNTTYNVAVTTGIMDMFGNAMTSNYVWSFTTGNAQDLTPPSVISTAPTNTATNVPVNQVLSAMFSEQVDPTTVTSSSFLLSGPSGTVTGSVLYNSTNMTAYFTPSALLASSTTYTATLTTGIKDLASSPNTLAADYIWSFTTAPAPSITTPTLPDGTVSQASYSVSITYNGGVPPYSWSSTTLPGGLSIDSNTGIISGTPSSSGTYTFDVTVTDSEGLTDSQGFSLTVNSAPLITTPTLTIYSATEGTLFNLPAVVSGGTGTLIWQAKGLPAAGLSLSSNTGPNNSITGTISAGAAGGTGESTPPYLIGLSVYDSNSVSSPTVTITLTALAPVSGITLTPGGGGSGAIGVNWPNWSDATAYTIYYSQSTPVTTSSSFSSVTVPPGPPATISGLISGQVYYFNVSAVYSAGTSSLLISSETSTTAP